MPKMRRAIPRSGNMRCKFKHLSIQSINKSKLKVYIRWFFSPTRIVYAIHGGPMAGRINYQTASYQCIRPGELWQCNWLEGISPPHPSSIHTTP